MPESKHQSLVDKHKDAVRHTQQLKKKVEASEWDKIGQELDSFEKHQRERRHQLELKEHEHDGHQYYHGNGHHNDGLPHLSEYQLVMRMRRLSSGSSFDAGTDNDHDHHHTDDEEHHHYHDDHHNEDRYSTSTGSTGSPLSPPTAAPASGTQLGNNYGSGSNSSAPAAAAAADASSKPAHAHEVLYKIDYLKEQPNHGHGTKYDHTYDKEKRKKQHKGKSDSGPAHPGSKKASKQKHGGKKSK